MKTIVLGSGIIGTTTAYYLAKAGHEVHVIERQPEAAMETSFANGGVLHTSEAEPWSRPGMPRAVLSWIGKEDAPMLLRLSALPSMWQWGLDFIRNCGVERYRKAVLVNLRLANHTLSLMDDVRKESGVEYDLMQKGTLKIYTRREALDKNVAESERQREVGLIFEAVDARRCVEIEPALAPIEKTLVGGIYAPPDEHGDCHKFAVGLRKYCTEKLGVTFHFNTEIKRIVRSGDQVASVETSAGSMTGDAYVAALASFAPALLGPLGVKVSIYPAKGVTVTVPDTGWPDGPSVPIIDDTRLFGLIRLGNRYRCSGSVEFTGWDVTPSPARAQAIVDNVIGVFPEFAKCYDKSSAKVWSGLRPMPSSGNPYVGPTQVKNLYLNCGHGHLGWTLACGSSHLLADVVSGRKPAIDMTGLTLATHA
ncbi:MAG: D-amino acid dehydrogenase [Bauldia sp.]|uniref:D-amino acid dehydrogenase n=1 Tax=Bauldia sp. TaxID=2575872 RepID=UPI001DF99A72|nr:D-amino acid dehydrogenase [Bauldia sp.]MCB1497843.1 D-amino acid dehydrogenase [Bauldia sp.]